MLAGNLSPSGVAGRGSAPVTSVAAATAATASRVLSREAVCCVGLVLILVPDFGLGCGTGSVAGGALGTGSGAGAAAGGCGAAGGGAGAGSGSTVTGGGAFSGCADFSGCASWVGAEGETWGPASNNRDAIWMQPITIRAAAPAMISGRVRCRGFFSAAAPLPVSALAAADAAWAARRAAAVQLG